VIELKFNLQCILHLLHLFGFTSPLWSSNAYSTCCTCLASLPHSEVPWCATHENVCSLPWWMFFHSFKSQNRKRSIKFPIECPISFVAWIRKISNLHICNFRMLERKSSVKTIRPNTVLSIKTLNTHTFSYTVVFCWSCGWKNLSILILLTWNELSSLLQTNEYWNLTPAKYICVSWRRHRA
jgi:hypothetical protein